jgi:hypothetical protein
LARVSVNRPFAENFINGAGPPGGSNFRHSSAKSNARARWKPDVVLVEDKASGISARTAGYVPMDVGDVLTRSRGGGVCYELAVGTRLYQTPNRSSQIVDEVGPESEIMSQADAIGGYALVKTAHGSRGFVTGAAIGQSVGCAEAFESE